MIKNNECKLTITTRNIKYYKDRGYNCIVNDTISIDVSTMPKNSHNIVIAICEVCSKELELAFSKYNTNKNRAGFYSCKGCSNIKRKETNINIHGVENVFQRDDVRENNKVWMSSKEFRQKSEYTQIDKYGCLYTQTSEFKSNASVKHREIIKGKKERNEYSTFLSLPENNELKKNGMFQKYGATYSFHIMEIKNKIQKTNLEKYGHISPLGNKEIQRKIKNNIIYKSLEREWSFNGDKYKMDLFRIYRRKVRYETDMIRISIFDSWDGYDYYDNEFIKNNLSLNKNHNNYPSIDHKISCFYGFINNLDTKIISDISNLCITKRVINSRKSQLNEDEFIKIISQVVR